LNESLSNTSLSKAPDKHQRKIEDAKIKVTILKFNSPYSEVRAAVEPRDGPDLPCSTIRV
jgi:hypothetical protein